MKIGFVFGLAAISLMLRAWIITWLWLWFIVPLGVTEIGLAWAIGLASIISMFSHDAPPAKASDETDMWAKAIGKLIVSPLLALGFGWLAHLAMVA